MIIDYHSHLGWNRETNTFETQQLLEDMDRNGVDIRMVSALYGYSIPEQNAAVAKFAQDNPGKILACAVINPKERDCLAQMREAAESGIFRAVELDSMEHCYYPLERSGNWKFLCFHLLPKTPWSFIAYGRSYVSEAAFACDGRISHGNLSAPRDDAV